MGEGRGWRCSSCMQPADDSGKLRRHRCRLCTVPSSTQTFAKEEPQNGWWPLLLMQRPRRPVWHAREGACGGKHAQSSQQASSTIINWALLTACTLWTRDCEAGQALNQLQ